MKSSISILLLCLYHTLFHGSLVSGCPSRCTCDNYGTDHLVDCNTREMGSFPDAIPEWTTTINFDGNYVRKLDLNQLPTAMYLKELRIRYNRIDQLNVSDHTANYRMREQCRHISRFFLQLYNVDLSGNRLRNLPDCLLVAWSNVKILTLDRNQFWDFNKLNFFNTRHYSYMLKTLKLRGNQFRQLRLADTNTPYNALRGLEELDLRDNLIEFIENGVFMHFHELKELLLSGNTLKRIEEYTFVTTGTHLKKIDLSNNQINFISSNAFAGNPELSSINLRSNSLLCLQFASLASTCFYLPNSTTVHYVRHRRVQSRRYSRWESHWPLNLTSLLHIRLSDNRWHCDCVMHRRMTSDTRSLVQRAMQIQMCANLSPEITIGAFLKSEHGC